MEKDNFNINILSIFVEKVLQEVGHWIVCDMSTNNDVPAMTDRYYCEVFQSPFSKNTTEHKTGNLE